MHVPALDGSKVLRCVRVACAAALMLGLLGGCGWRLQGTAKLPAVMSITYIDAADRYSDFNRALSEGLAAAGARVTSNRDEATAVVEIKKDQSGQRPLPVSARNTLEEYEVFYQVEYVVFDHDGELIPTQTLQVTQDYSYDRRFALAKQREQASLREALARDLAGLVVRRVAAL